MFYIAVDFDGTIVTHEYPNIGRDIGAFEWLKKFQEYDGVKLILYTMRSGKELQEAVEFCRENDVEFWAVNDNPDQYTWTNSRKVYAHKYIDDAAIGCFLTRDISGLYRKRPFVRWDAVGPEVIYYIENSGLIKKS